MLQPFLLVSPQQQHQRTTGSWWCKTQQSPTTALPDLLMEALCNKKNSSDRLVTVVLSGMLESESQAPLLLYLDSDPLSACLTQRGNIFPSASTVSLRTESEREGEASSKKRLCETENWYLAELFSILPFVMQHRPPLATRSQCVCATRSCLLCGWGKLSKARCCLCPSCPLWLPLAFTLQGLTCAHCPTEQHFLQRCLLG